MYYYQCQEIAWDTENYDVELPSSISFELNDLLSVDEIIDLLSDIAGWFVNSCDIINISDEDGNVLKTAY